MRKSSIAKRVLLILSPVLILALGSPSYSHAAYGSLHRDAVVADHGWSPDVSASVRGIGVRGRLEEAASDLTPPGDLYIIEGGSSTPPPSTLTPPSNLQVVDPSKGAVDRSVGQIRNPFPGYFEELAGGAWVPDVSDLTEHE